MSSYRRLQCLQILQMSAATAHGMALIHATTQKLQLMMLDVCGQGVNDRASAHALVLQSCMGRVNRSAISR